MYKYTYKLEDNQFIRVDFHTKEEYLDFLLEKCKIPGEYNLGEESLLFYSEATKFRQKGYYTNKVKGSTDFKNYWDFQKELFDVGLIVGDNFICGNHYLYLNFLPITDKIKKRIDFPDLWDTDIYTFLSNEIAKEKFRFLVGTKARQKGVSTKFLVEFINRIWFKQGQSCKFLAFDKAYINKSWTEILENYRNFLNTHTAFYRGFLPDKLGDWKQAVEIKEEGRKRYVGTMSTLVGVTFKENPAKAVGGNLSYAFADEIGVAPNFDKVMQYLIPALKAGSILTGHFVAMGSVGELKDCEPLKAICYAPESYQVLDFPNIFEDRPTERIAFFIPANWSFFGFIDKYGNSDTEGAKQFILNEREEKKKLSPRDYQLAISQNPLTLAEAFGSREENPFPTEIIQPFYEKLIRSYEPMRVTLVEENGKITHKFGSDAPPVIDLPVKKDTDKRGCVLMYEPPLYETPPIGLYYAACDPVTQIKTVTSDSLQSFYVYRADFYQDETLVPGELVAWYCGRYDRVDDTYEICRKLMKYYNARTMIESDKDGFIRWLIGKGENFLMMKRSEYPRLQEILPNSQVFEDYGIRKGSSSTFRDHLIESIVRYVSEEISVNYDKEGNAVPVYGVERIRDHMLLKEMLEFNYRGNFDRILSFAYLINVAEGNTIRQRLRKIRENKSDIADPRYGFINVNQFKQRDKEDKLKINPFQNGSRSNLKINPFNNLKTSKRR